MSKTWIVARCEYIRAVRTKAFIIGVALMPVLMGAGLIVTAIMKAVVDIEDRHFAIVDRTGELYAEIKAKLDHRNAEGIWDDEHPEVQADHRFLLEEPAAAPTDGVAPEMALAERVRDEELIGYLVIGADVIHGKEGGDVEVAWHTETPTYNDIPSWLKDVINGEIRTRRVKATGLDQELVSKLVKHVMASITMNKKGLPSVSDTGEMQEAEVTHKGATFGVPIGLCAMIYMLLLMNAPALMNSVLEEKMQRISEVLISSVSPFQLLLGKVMSSVMVAMSLMLIYVGAALVVVHINDSVPDEIRDALSFEVLAWFVFFLFMGLVILGSMCAALGAACSEIRDAQSLMMPVIGSILVPLLFVGVVVSNPNGTVSQLVSYFPTGTPLLMFLRVAIPPGVPWWELVLSVSLMLGFSTLCVLAGSKIFRIGILSQGQAPSLRKILSWITSR